MRAPSPAWTALAAGLVASAAAAPAPAALLDQPPRQYTFKLADPSARLPLLDPFRDAAVDPSSGLRRYLAGTWARWRSAPWWALTWQAPAGPASVSPAAPLEALALAPSGRDALLAEEGDASLFGFGPAVSRALSIAPESAPTWMARMDPLVDAPLVPTTGSSFRSNGFDALWVLPPKKPIPNWRCRRRPVRIARYGGESDMFALVRCDGAAALEAYDRLTLLAREATAPRPGELLPDEPDPVAVTRGEWTSGVRLAHPRLLWVLQRIADAFPWRTIYVYSGYRYDPSFRTNKPGSHHSMHAEARALDLTVMGIPNAALFQVCQRLEDVGCGFYPNNRFVHVDVRQTGSGHPFWIDVSAPGEPSRYVDAWPGVVERGALVWDPAGRRSDPTKPGAEASCTPTAGRTRP